MYKIINTNTQKVIGFVDNLRYLTYDPENKVLFKREDAEGADGISVNGVAYNINGNEVIPRADMVNIIEIDGGEYLFANHSETVKNTEDLTSMQELILTQDNQMNSLEEALMDLDNQMNTEE